MAQVRQVRVDSEQCGRIAGLLKTIAVPAAEEDAPLAGLAVHDLPDFYLALVAVCHQTSPISGVRLEGVTAAGQHLFGWDYLCARWAERVVEDRSWNEPERWAGISAQDVVWILRDSRGSSTISDAEGRAGLLRNLGEGMIRNGWPTATALYEAGGGRLVAGKHQPGLYELLARFRAYDDPIRKKSCFFLELMRGQCGWRYEDAAHLGAPVDYHEVRGHLRLGTVVIEDRGMAVRVASGQEMTAVEDQAIRGAVYEAILRIASAHGATDAATLHYFFWNLFRRCCARNETHCFSCGSQCKLPERYRQAIAAVAPDRCFFSPACASAGAERMLTEHTHRTAYY